MAFLESCPYRRVAQVSWTPKTDHRFSHLQGWPARAIDDRPIREGSPADATPTPLKQPKRPSNQLSTGWPAPLLQRANTGTHSRLTRRVRTVTKGIPVQSPGIQVNWRLETVILPRNHAVLAQRTHNPIPDLPSGPLSGYDYLRRKDGLRTER